MERYYDVNNLSELPPLLSGRRYFDFIGGSKEIRCFPAPEDKPRGEFIEENEEFLDECLHPIYKNDGICVRQDASYPVPGFYIINPIRSWRSLDIIDELTFLRLFYILREVRKGMREVLNIPYAHIYYEEKINKSCNVHFWLLPIYDIEKSPRIYNFNILEYLTKYKLSEEKKKIIECNGKMKEYLKTIQLLDKDNLLKECILANLV